MYVRHIEYVRKSYIALGIDQRPSDINVRVCMAVLSYILDFVMLVVASSALLAAYSLL